MISPTLTTSLSIAEDLIRIHSLADRPEDLRRIVLYVEDFFRDQPQLYIKRYESGGKPSIVISTHSAVTPTVLLLGHLDVVPAPEHLFEPVYKDSILYGRGACDMKTEVALMMLLMKEYASLDKKPNVALMLTTDEEIGGHHGAEYLIHTIGYRCRVALVPDGGESMDDLILKNKGVLHVRLSFSGKTAHGSRPWLGENAIEKMLKTLQSLKDFFPCDGNERHWHNTASIGTITGGKATNQVPEEAACALDIRFIEASSPSVLIEKLQQAAPDARIEIIAQGDMSMTPVDNEYVNLYAHALKEHTGLSPCFNESHGSNDGRFLTALGIPVLVSRPRSGGQHSPEEWLDTKELETFKEIYNKIILQADGLLT